MTFSWSLTPRKTEVTEKRMKDARTRGEESVDDKGIHRKKKSKYDATGW
jgi:hypothetical protein